MAGKRASTRAGPKIELHSKKIMLCVWWAVHGVIFWELLPPAVTVNSGIYRAQLDKLEAEVRKMRPQHEKIYFLHDNARPHVSKLTRNKILEQGWEVLPHPPYSPDLAPTDYHLFRSLGNSLRDKKFDDANDIQKYLTDFFASQSRDFCANGIRSLPTRWQMVVDNGGAYIID